MSLPRGWPAFVVARRSHALVGGGAGGAARSQRASGGIDTTHSNKQERVGTHSQHCLAVLLGGVLVRRMIRSKKAATSQRRNIKAKEQVV